MKLSDAERTIEEANGKHLQRIYVPSIQQFVYFLPLQTDHVKLLTRMQMIDFFDISIQFLKLGLFDKLCTTDLSDRGITSKTLTLFDYMSFLIGIRRMLKNDVIFTFTCKKCYKKFTNTIALDEYFDEDLQRFRPQTLEFQTVDEVTNTIWKFQLKNFTMQNYLYYKYVLNQLQQKNPQNVKLLNDSKWMRFILYIDRIWLNNQEIDDWRQLSFPTKLSFFNKIPPNVTFNQSVTNTTLCKFIQDNFAEEALQRKIASTTVKCPHCQTIYRGVYKIDNFFIFSGFRKTT